MAQCIAKTQDGTPCQIPTRTGQRYCHVHRRQRLWRWILSFSVLAASALGILSLVADITGLLSFLGINPQPTPIDLSTQATSTQPFLSLFALIAEGDASMSEGDFKNAIDYYQRAISIDPNDSEIWTKTGLAYIGLAVNDTECTYVIDHALEADRDLFEQALPYFDKAIKIDTENRDAYIYRGIILYRRGNLHCMFGPPNCDYDAFTQFTKAISIPLNERNIDPYLLSRQNSCAYYGLAKMYEKIYEQIGVSWYKDEAERYLQCVDDPEPSCTTAKP